MHRLIALVFVIASVAAAQDKITVPLSDPSQPAKLKGRLIAGSISVKVGTGPQIVVESMGNGKDLTPTPNNPPPGMHRIDAGARGFTIVEDHNVVTIGNDRVGRHMDLVVQVPANTSVELRIVNGGQIDITGISGDLDVENINGPIELKNVSGGISAHTINGTVTVNLDRTAPDKPMSFSSLNGKLDVTLPADTKARLRLKTNNGEVYSDFDVKMEPDTSKPVVEDSRGQGGRYRIRMDRGVIGSINGGGPEYSFQTMNGTILIHKK
jgi:hypothetical protein